MQTKSRELACRVQCLLQPLDVCTPARTPPSELGALTRVTSPKELKPTFFRIFGRWRGQISQKMSVLSASRRFLPWLCVQHTCQGVTLQHEICSGQQMQSRYGRHPSRNNTRVTSPKEAKTNIFSNIWPLARPNIA